MYSSISNGLMSKHHEFSSSSRVFVQAMICANHDLADKQCHCNLYTGHSARLDKQCHCDLYTAHNCCYKPQWTRPAGAGQRVDMQSKRSEWTQVQFRRRCICSQLSQAPVGRCHVDFSLSGVGGVVVLRRFTLSHSALLGWR